MRRAPTPAENPQSTTEDSAVGDQNEGTCNESALLARLVHQETASAHRLAMSIVRDGALAEDVVQESFVKAWLALPSWRGEAPIRHWLLRIVHNTAISMLRSIRDVQTEPEVLAREPGRLDVSKHVENLVALEKLWEALGAMDELSRTVVVLREIEGLSYEEICAILDAPMPTVKTRLYRARRLLAAAMEEAA